ncbi:MAG: ABC transporter ATP-binding protein [Roseburia sp.]|nr:ABC transporter ATP-binding protein [Roseburia sp.]
MGKLMEARNLAKKYDEGTTESRVVDHVNLEVEEQEFVVIMGASGSGKTSLLHLLAGIESLDEGTIRYKDRDLGNMSEKAKAIFRRRNIGLVFQQYCLIPDLTVYENIMLPVMLERKRKGEKDAAKDMILNFCRQLSLESHMGKYPSQLSGGQQQRVAILRAIVNKPILLLCDEPTGSLNSSQAEIVMKLLNVLNKKGQTIVLVTHDIKVAVQGKRVIYIKDGSISGELKFSEQEPGKTDAKEIYRQREEELMTFLQKRGW